MNNLFKVIDELKLAPKGSQLWAKADDSSNWCCLKVIPLHWPDEALWVIVPSEFTEYMQAFCDGDLWYVERDSDKWKQWRLKYPPSVSILVCTRFSVGKPNVEKSPELLTDQSGNGNDATVVESSDVPSEATDTADPHAELRKLAEERPDWKVYRKHPGRSEWILTMFPIWQLNRQYIVCPEWAKDFAIAHQERRLKVKLFLGWEYWQDAYGNDVPKWGNWSSESFQIVDNLKSQSKGIEDKDTPQNSTPDIKWKSIAQLNLCISICERVNEYLDALGLDGECENSKEVIEFVMGMVAASFRIPIAIERTIRCTN